MKQKGAHEVLINKSKLISEIYEKISIDPEETNELIEARLIHEHVQHFDILNVPKDSLKQKINQLLSILSREIKDGEKVKDYDQEILEGFYKILNIEGE